MYWLRGHLGVAYLSSLNQYRLFRYFLCWILLFNPPTTLSTYWQEHVDENIRGRVAAIWVLSFGGTVPFGNLIAGPLVDATSLSAVLYFSAIFAWFLCVFTLKQGPVIGEEILEVNNIV